MPPAAIVGIADAVPRRDERPDYWHLAARTAMEALRDAGLGVKDVDGVVFERTEYTSASAFTTDFCQYMGIRPAWMETQAHGGAQEGALAYRAALAIEHGLASTVLIVSTDNRRTRLANRTIVGQIASHHMHAEFEVPYGPLIPSAFALMAQRYMHEYGVTSEQFAEVAVAGRRWAQLTPGATMTEPITVDDVLGSRMITSPLHLLDLCLVTDGGGAAVMVDGHRAADFANPAVHLLGYGDSGVGQDVTFMPDLIDSPSWRRAMDDALRLSGATRSDIDVGWIYDPATSTVLWSLEQLGFCAPGEAGEFVGAGHTSPGGTLPLNTNGGLLSYCHPGGPGAMIGIVEVVRQLRGNCGERQVPDARVGISTALSGFMTVGVNIFGRID